MASWRSLRSAVFSSVMSRAKSDTDRGAVGAVSGPPPGWWATIRADTGIARPWRVRNVSSPCQLPSAKTCGSTISR